MHLSSRGIARIALPLAAWAAIAVFSAYLVDPGAAAEGAYLGLVAVAVLLTAAALSPAPAVDVGFGAVLVTTAVWVLPVVPTRGATVMALLLATLAVAAGRRLAAVLPDLPWAATLPLAVGVQLLLRTDRLLAPVPDLGWVLDLLAWPLLGAWALAVLARGLGPALPLVAAASVVALGPGWTPAGTLGLLALAGVELLSDRGLPLHRWVRLAFLPLTLLAAFAWEPRTALILSLAATARGVAGSRYGPAVVALAAAGAQILLPSIRSWEAAGGLLAWLPLMLPAAVLARPGERDRAVLALLLALVACRAAPEEAILPALALLALTLPAAGTALELQAVWSGVLLGGSALLGAYPWLRARPAATLVRLFGLEPGWALALIAVALLLLVALALAPLRRRWPERAPRPFYLGLAILFVGLWWGLPRTAFSVLEGSAIVLDPASPRWEIELPEPVGTTEIVVDSYLSYGTLVDAGTTVATVAIAGQGASPTRRQLLSGRDTGEWAARRPDVAATPGLLVPSPWISWVAPEGPHFGQSYRARLTLDLPVDAERLSVELAPALPSEVALTLLRVELRP